MQRIRTFFGGARRVVLEFVAVSAALVGGCVGGELVRVPLDGGVVAAQVACR